MNEQDFVFLSELERYDAFLALFRSEDPAAKDELAGLYGTRDPVVPLILLQYLSDIPEREAVAPIVALLDSENPVVARAAMEAYHRSHYPGKARQLNAQVLSKNEFACRFAVRTLSRAGFMDCLPLILREIPDRDGAVLAEMIDAVRYLPDRRSVPVLMPLAESPHEPTRFRALLALSEVQARERALSADYFLQKAHDESERVRRCALEALRFYPDKSVAKIFLARGLDENETDTARERAIRSLEIFPSPLWVQPLAGLFASSGSASVRMAVEIALRGFPVKDLRQGFLPLLTRGDADARRAATLLAAQFLSDDPEVRRAILDIWRGASDMEALNLTEVLRELGGAEARALLIDAVSRGPLLAAAAANALGRMRLEGDAERVLALVEFPKTPNSAKHALLSHWARHGVDETLREGLLPWLIANLEDPVINTRYLSLLALTWYPFERKLPAILGLISRETSPDILRDASSQIVKELGRDPLPLLLALRDHPGRDGLVGHAVRILTSQSWDPARVPEVIRLLAEPPLDLLSTRTETFFTVCIHFLRDESLSIESLWDLLDSPPRLLLFLRMLASFLAGKDLNFPPLPVAFLSSRLAGAEPQARAYLYEILSRDLQPDTIEELTELVVREQDEACARIGRSALRRLLVEAPR